jgi:hypothetical protein
MNDEGNSPRGAEPDGRYANYFEIGHNAFEFLLDFGQHYADRTWRDATRAQVHTRIVTGPVYAKALLALLAASVTEHERLYGVIPAVDEDDDRHDAPEGH